jgi:hypothetical protein
MARLRRAAGIGSKCRLCAPQKACSLAFCWQPLRAPQLTSIWLSQSTGVARRKLATGGCLIC